MRAKSAPRRGQTIILFTLALIPLLGIMGLAVDIGWAHFRREAAQTAADSAAMAAALAAQQAAAGSSVQCGIPGIACYASEYSCPSTISSPPSDNVQAGCMYARDNGFVTAGKQKVTFQSGTGLSPTTPGVTTSYWVVVRVSEDIPQLFSAALGFPTASMTARATAGIRDSNAGGCVITLNPTASGALTMTGTTTLQTGCGVFVNSNNPYNALTTSGGGTINTTGTARTQVVGAWSGGGFVDVNGVPSAPIYAPPIDDPMAALQPPPIPGNTLSVPNIPSHGTATIDPGYYPGGISLGSQRTLNLNPGVYYINGGISLGAQTNMFGSGVTLYIHTGAVTMTGGGTVTLSAPTTGPWQGILFYQDRNDTSYSKLTGGTSQELTGTLYFPAAPLDFAGGTSNSTNAPQTTIIADTLRMVGNSYITAQAQTAFTGNTNPVSLIE